MFPKIYPKIHTYTFVAAEVREFDLLCCSSDAYAELFPFSGVCLLTANLPVGLVFLLI
jgi:hypothetical protein